MQTASPSTFAKQRLAIKLAAVASFLTIIMGKITNFFTTIEC